MRARPSTEFILFLSLLSSSFSISFGSAAGAGTTTTTTSPFSNVVQQITRHGQATWNRSNSVVQQMSRRGHATLTRSIPALSLYSGKDPSRQTVEVAAAVKQRKKRKLPQLHREQLEGGGFYYGVTTKTLSKATTPTAPEDKRPNLSQSMYEALEELKYLRQEMERMRKDMQTLRQKMIDDGDLEENPEEMRAKELAMKRKRQKESEKLASEIEDWARQILKETEDDGWKEVPCSKVMRKSLNPTERTTAYLKWMKDSRGEMAAKTDDNDYPCIKCYSTIDAPLEDVCTYLSEEAASPEYNDLVVKYKDVEEISPNAKICWSQSPQILFLKPREFITFCHHHWKRDGSEVIVNQAWDHPDYPATNDENTAGKSCRALALRGANFLSRDPDDPEKTRIVIVAHANPGGNVPQWASKTAVNALAPIEPYKLFHKINEAVQKNQEQLRKRLQHAEMVSTLPPGRSPRPAGIAQLGYACFWPNGGGVAEGGYSKEKSNDDGSSEQQSAELGSLDGGVAEENERPSAEVNVGGSDDVNSRPTDNIGESS